MSATIQKAPESSLVTACPFCNSSIVIDNPIKIGRIYECPKCATESEIIDLNPLTLSPLEEEK